MSHNFRFRIINTVSIIFDQYPVLILVPLFLSLVVNSAAQTQLDSSSTSENSSEKIIMDSKSLSTAVAKFSAKFCNELDKDKSVVSSPLSAEFVLALLALGSTDVAHTELLTSLGIPNDDDIRSSFSEVSNKLKALKGVTLNVANKVYIKDGDYELNPTLEADAIKVFDAQFEKIDFSSHDAANTINKWVESKTNNKIKDLLSPDCLNEMTALVLVNALYFKGTWEKQFNSMHTAPRPFHITTSKSVEVAMMYQEQDFRFGYSEELNAQLLQMHYEGREASMVIVLPNEIDGLGEVLDKLAKGHDLMTDIEKMFSTKVQVTIPKFKIETEIDLAALLPKLGIKEIFNPNCTGLSKLLTSEEPLFVSKAVQKAFIEVNEEGAEAAAATGMVMMLRCAMMSPRFVADHPFLYILTGADNVPTFIGLYRADPSQ